MQHDGVRTEIRRTFIEGEGYLIEEVQVGSPLGQNQVIMPAVSAGPPLPVVVTIADVPLSLAQQVVESHGMLVVPASFLNEAQLEELKIDPSTLTPPTPSAELEQGGKLTEAQAIKLVKAAESFDDLNRLTANDSRAKVLAAAESRAAELKEQGKQ